MVADSDRKESFTNRTTPSKANTSDRSNVELPGVVVVTFTTPEKIESWCPAPEKVRAGRRALLLTALELRAKTVSPPTLRLALTSNLETSIPATVVPPNGGPR
jgi:hypothetical protein